MEGQESALLEPGLPKVVLTEKIQNPNCPYNLSFDAHGAAELLRVAGVKEDDIPGITVKLDRYKGRRPSKLGDPNSFFAAYSKPDKTISIYADMFWATRELLIKRTEEKIKSEDLQSASSPFTSRRVESYFKYAPPERVERTIETLATIKANKGLTEAIAHEASHAADYSQMGHLTPTEKQRLGHKVANMVAAGWLSFESANILNADIPVSMAIASGVALYFLKKSEPVDYFDRENEVKAREIAQANKYKFSLVSFTEK